VIWDWLQFDGPVEKLGGEVCMLRRLSYIVLEVCRGMA
jgi:hypothetical protein